MLLPPLPCPPGLLLLLLPLPRLLGLLLPRLLGLLLPLLLGLLLPLLLPEWLPLVLQPLPLLLLWLLLEPPLLPMARPAGNC